MASFSINGVLQASYKYDFAGRQAIRTLVSSGVTIHSVFDADGNRIAEYNEATGALIREYAWFNGAPIAVIEGGLVSLVRNCAFGCLVIAASAVKFIGSMVGTAVARFLGYLKCAAKVRIKAASRSLIVTGNPRSTSDVTP